MRKKLNLEDRKFCFELFGYDFFIDEQFKVWLIEVNTNPCLEESSGLLKTLLPRMVDDMLKITIDQIFPRKRWNGNFENDKKIERFHRVPKYFDYENMWEFICQIGFIKRNPKNISFLNSQRATSVVQSNLMGAQIKT